MKNKILYLSLFIGIGVGLATFPLVTLAAPNVTGAVMNGGSITVSGGEFGEKATPAPVKWDNFEGGIVGSPVGNNWYTYFQSAPPTYSVARLRNGSSKSVRHDFVTTGNFNSSYGVNIVQPEYYFTFWMNYDQIGSDQSAANIFNYKPHQMYGSNSSNGGTPLAQTGLGGFPDDRAWRGNVIDENQHNTLTPTASVYGDITLAELTDTWTRYECYYEQSTPGIPDGDMECVFYRPGISYHSLIKNDIITRQTATYNWNQVLMGEYQRRQSGDMSAYNYSDDAYFDNTRARLELCDASTWATRTSCEIQIPTIWTANAITATFNRGAFGNGTTAYIYVVDANGAVNATGRAVTIPGGGGGTDTQAPAIPSGFVVM